MQPDDLKEQLENAPADERVTALCDVFSDFKDAVDGAETTDDVHGLSVEGNLRDMHDKIDDITQTAPRTAAQKLGKAIELAEHPEKADEIAGYAQDAIREASNEINEAGPGNILGNYAEQIDAGLVDDYSEHVAAIREVSTGVHEYYVELVDSFDDLSF